MTPRDRRVLILTVLVVYALLSTNLPKVRAQTTTISNLQYPSEVVLQNGMAQATVTFALGYSNLPSGDALLFGIALASNPGTAVAGSGTSTPDPCQSSWANVDWPGKAECAVTPSSSSGVESITFTITSATSPQQYTLLLFASMADPSPHLVSGSESEQTLTITVVSGAGTDWAVLSVSLDPSNPNIGDQVIFSTVITALSSSGTFPQTVQVGCILDSMNVGSGTVSYPGPVGVPMTVSSQTPWTATLGPHTLTCAVATIPAGLDSDKSNNVMSITFTVAQAPPQQTTTASSTYSTTSQAPSDFQVNVTPSSQTVFQGETVSYAVNVVGLNGFNSQVSLAVSGLPSGASGVFSVPAANPNFASTLTITLPISVPAGSFTLTVTGTGGGTTHVANVLLTVNQSTQSSSTIETTTAVGGSITDIIQQNPLILLAAILLILVTVLALRRRPSGPTPVTQPSSNVVYCTKCGNQNPTTNQYCSRCGAKLG